MAQPMPVYSNVAGAGGPSALTKSHLPRLHERLQDIANRYGELAARAENLADRMSGTVPETATGPSQARPQATSHVAVFEDASDNLDNQRGRLESAISRLEQSI